MSDEYTPDTGTLRRLYVRDQGGEFSSDIAAAEFDRFIAKVQSDAWEKAVYHIEPFIGSQKRREALADNPYRGAS